MFRNLSLYRALCFAFLITAFVTTGPNYKVVAGAGCENTDNKTRVKGGDECLVIRTFDEQLAPDAQPILVVFIHGDKSSGNPIKWEYTFAGSFDTPQVVSVALLRPGYNDDSGAVSTGSNFGRRDSYTAHNIDAVAEAIKALKEHYGASKVLLVGYSGGAAYTGVIIGRHPGLIDGAVLVACPCNIFAWRWMKNARPWPRSLSPHEFVNSVLRTTRVIAVTGTYDTNTPPSLAENYVKMLQKRDVVAEFRPAEAKTHNSVTGSVVFSGAVHDLINEFLVSLGKDLPSPPYVDLPSPPYVDLPSPPYVSEDRRQKFQRKFLNAPFNRAFAISKDGAFGGQWGMSKSLDEVKEFALKSCRKKPQYRPENPCMIYMENDAVVWKENLATNPANLANTLPMIASNALAINHNGIHDLLSKDDPPIHIGDGRGAIEDIEHSLRSSNPPDDYTWTFKLDEVPDTMIFAVTIFSLVSYSEKWDCPTTVWLNGTRVYDLRDGEDVGTGKTTTAQFLAEKRHLKQGNNTFRIKEERCRNSNGFALNDSLVKGVMYRF